MKTLLVNEPVRVWATGTGGYPLRFFWRGRYHRVRTIVGYDRRFTQSPTGRSEIRRYRLRTDSGLRCILSHDPARGHWRIDRIHNAHRR